MNLDKDEAVRLVRNLVEGLGTSTAADLLRESERGRIQSGCFADLLVVNGDPSEAITMASRKENHRLVVKNGVEI